MPIRAYATDSFACTRAMKRQMVLGMTTEEHRDLLTQVFAKADALAFMWDAAVRAQGIADLEAFCQSLPCLPWAPEDRTRHVEVQIYGRVVPVVISVARAMWACVHVVSAQGAQLRADEQLHHTCRLNGHGSTGHGACLNPAHFIRGDEKTRLQLRDARAKFDKVMRRAGVHV